MLFWTNGVHELHCGDARDVLPSLPAVSVDAVITSPPYNCGKEYGAHDDAQPLAAYWSWLEDVLSKACRLLRPHGYLCVNHGNYIGTRSERVGVDSELVPMLDRLLPAVDRIIWDKGPPNSTAWGNFRTSPRMRAQHENIHVHGGCAKMPESDIEWAEWSRFTTSIWNIAPTGVDKSVHPAMMPVEVAYRLCRLYSPQHGTVLDPFAGSGTTGVACARTGRRFIGIEIDTRHCETAVARIRKELDSRRLPGMEPHAESPTLFV